jgi:cytidylate kinase
MPVVTIDGYRGSGSTEIGVRVAQALNASYVDRLLMRRVAERTRVPTSELVGRTGREHAPASIKGGVLRLLERWLDFYARHSVYINPWEDFAFLGHYRGGEEPKSQSTPSPRFLSDPQFIEALAAALHEVAQSDNLVVVGRGGCMVLKDYPNALHVGLSASAPTRILRNMRKHNFSLSEAARFTKATDVARRRYYRRFFDTMPEDPSLYTLSFNTEVLRPELAVQLIVSRASVMAGGRTN